MRTVVSLGTLLMLTLAAGLLWPRPELAEAVGVSAISAGGEHTCALTTEGGVKCWGSNFDGKLGDGTTTDRSTPVGVVGLESGVAAVATGPEYTCALTTAGGVKCWGDNSAGQLGDGTTADRSAPVDVVGLSTGIAGLAMPPGFFGAHTCALTTAGGVKCWGANGSGQLGIGTSDFDSHPTPVDVVGLDTSIIAVTAGSSHTCALTTAGGVMCWGDNSLGQLGDGQVCGETCVTPVDIVGLESSVAAITAGGEFTCALTSADGVKCWGWNVEGELGDGTSGNIRLTPVDALGLESGVAAINAGNRHTCALTTASGVKCWGNNRDGQLGDGTGGFGEGGIRASPVDVVGLDTGVAAIAAGGAHTCALTTTGAVKCWGASRAGQLGNERTSLRTTPADVTGLGSGVVSVSAGAFHTCSITTGAGVKCWGDNSRGQLGDGTIGTDRAIPIDVSLLSSGVAAVATGTFHTCALTTAGGVKCWGLNDAGQVGDGTTTDRRTPVDVVGLGSGVVAIAAGGNHACVLTSAGGVKCWGVNFSGRLGAETTEICGSTTPCSTTPVDVLVEPGGAPLTGVNAIAAGANHTCALNTAGGLKCWGENRQGELGIGTSDFDSHPTPVDVVGLGSGVVAIAAGGNHACVLTSAGGVKCWGANGTGQLGAETTDNCGVSACSLTPVDVSGLSSDVAAVAVGGGHTCALITLGGVKCWGANGSGQLGIGTSDFDSHPTPVDVMGLDTSIIVVTAGSSHTCALTTAGGVKCWGGNRQGELGDGTGGRMSATPVDVFGLGEQLLLDSDGDGCTGEQELGLDPTRGGLRDPKNFWDFFDPNRDRSVTLLDFLAVLRHFGTVGDPSTLDLDGPEPPIGDYWALADRGGQAPGGDPWDELPANGSIGLADFLSVLRQFGHTCA